MNKLLRKPLIAGNWKMNKTPAEAVELINEIKPLIADATCDVLACVPAIDIPCVIDSVKGSDIFVGGQNCHFENSGAFTGEISATMLKSLNVSYVIVGHSERRSYFGDTDETVAKRLKAGLESGLKVILCVGESLEQRDCGVTEDLVTMQTKIALNGLSEDEIKNVIIAYEPIWAIGTGRTATSDQAQEVCHLIRNVIKNLYNDSVAQSTVILYGGSMNASNAEELLSKEDVDGGLIGGASLKPNDFAQIVKAASK